MPTTLFAWVNKLHVLKWDHTWVTTYDNRNTQLTPIGQVIAKGENYWYCWGDFHAQGNTPVHKDGFIGAGLCDLALAKCICESNLVSKGNRPAQGTIFTYGVDGVCHQLANQVLWATKTVATNPLTVHLARGYGASTFFFGTYGGQRAAWNQRLMRCTTSGRAADAGSNFMATSDQPDLGGDEFANHARAVLGEDEARFKSLIELRSEASEQIAVFRARTARGEGASPSAEELNTTYNNFYKRAAALLGKEAFEEIFGVPFGEAVNIVDSTQVDSRKPLPQ